MVAYHPPRPLPEYCVCACGERLPKVERARYLYLWWLHDLNDDFEYYAASAMDLTRSIDGPLDNVHDCIAMNTNADCEITVLIPGSCSPLTPRSPLAQTGDF